MSGVDVLRSFAEARMEDEDLIDNGVKYGHAREVIAELERRTIAHQVASRLLSERLKEIATLTAERDALRADLRACAEALHVANDLINMGDPDAACERILRALAEPGVQAVLKG